MQEITDIAPSFIGIIDAHIQTQIKDKPISPFEYNMAMDVYHSQTRNNYESYQLPNPSLVTVASFYFDPDFEEGQHFHSGRRAFEIEVHLALDSSLSHFDFQNLSVTLQQAIVNDIKLNDHQKASLTQLNENNITSKYGIFNAPNNFFIRSDLADKYIKQFKESFLVFKSSIEQTMERASTDMALNFSNTAIKDSNDFFISHKFIHDSYSYNTHLITNNAMTSKDRTLLSTKIEQSLIDSQMMINQTLESLAVNKILEDIVIKFNQYNIEALIIGEEFGELAVYYNENFEVYSNVLASVELISTWFKKNDITKIIINPDRYATGGIAYKGISYRTHYSVSLNGNDFTKLEHSIFADNQDVFFDYLDSLLDETK